MSLMSTEAVSTSCCLVMTVMEEARSESFVFRRVPDMVLVALYPLLSLLTTNGESSTAGSSRVFATVVSTGTGLFRLPESVWGLGAVWDQRAGPVARPR